MDFSVIHSSDISSLAQLLDSQLASISQISLIQFDLIICTPAPMA